MRTFALLVVAPFVLLSSGAVAGAKQDPSKVIVQCEDAYFLAGYDCAKKTEVGAAGVVDLETDVAALVQGCNPPPRESLWEKIEEHL